ncbi:MAG: hypothetical protein NTW86_10845 [Candidatus Sumerlaeota bacterium]|nr:hypothetical protein [Candidatus Sumerlaeota bacterium]
MKRMPTMLLMGLLAALAFNGQSGAAEGQGASEGAAQSRPNGAAAMKAQALARQRAQSQPAGEWVKAHLPRDHVDLIPLTDLGKGMYQGEQGGLYPNGENDMPAEHRKAGERLAREIRPLDAEGKLDENGKIVFMSVGFSNTSLEFSAFTKAVAEEKGLNPHLVAVNGAIGMQPAQAAADPNSDYWKAVDQQRLGQAGVTPKQVQVLWVKETYPGPHAPFPAEAKKLQGLLVQVMNTCQDRFPNVKLAYLASRIFAGYSIVGGNPEPWSYEFGFSAKWLIADQLAGKPELNYDPAKGPVRSPWLAWGPYLWADGVKPRGDGLVWLREDLTDKDGMHPSDKGVAKVVKMLMDFMKTDSTAKPWFVKQ